MPDAARLLRATVWLPAAALLAYAVSFGTQFRRMVGDFYWNSDIVSSMVLAEDVAQRGHGGIHFANSAPYSTVLLNSITHPLPGHREIWIAWPLVGALVAIAAIGWQVRRMAGTWAAVVAVSIATASTPLVLSFWITQGVHGRTMLAIALLGVLLLLILDGTLVRRRVLTLGLAVVIGFVAGTTAASDPLFIATGAAPAAVALAFHIVRQRRQQWAPLATGVGLTAAAATAGAVLIRFIAHREQMVRSGFEVHAASLSAAHQNFHVMGADIIDMAGGTVQDVGRAPAIVALVFLALVLAATVAAGWQVLRRRGVAGCPQPLGDANAALLVYWYLVGGATVGAFLFADVVIDELSTRYLLPLLFSVAVCTALLVHPPRRIAVAVPAAMLVSSLVAANTVTLFGTDTRGFHTDGLEQVIAQLDARNLHKGYGDYWVSNVITWQTGGRIAVRQVSQGKECSQDAPPAMLCPELFNSADDWYTASAEPTFLLVDPGSDVLLQPDPAAFGRPRETFGAAGFTVYVYGGDLRTAMAPAVTS